MFGIAGQAVWPRQRNAAEVGLGVGDLDRRKVAALEREPARQANRDSRPRKDRREVRILRLLDGITRLGLLHLLARRRYVGRLETHAHVPGGKLLDDAAGRKRDGSREER